MAEVEARIGEAQRESTNDLKGTLVNYEAKLILKGLNPQTILQRLRFLRLIAKRGGDLLDPASVFKTINDAKKWDYALKQVKDEDWSNGSKVTAAQAYKSFCEVVGIQIPEHINFDKWLSNRQPKLPWLPLESEIDALTAGCSKKIATFLQLLKEVWCRSGEAWRLRWTDVDVEHNIVTINSPLKGGLPRQFKVSSKLAAMLNMLPKNDDKVFGGSLDKLRQNFIIQRARTAHKLQNPRIKKISFHTLRHWGATMEYHRTKDILHVQERLGHRSITSTLIYTHLVDFEVDEYHVRTAKTLKEDGEFIEAGFEYVTERDGTKIYRKRK